jgi:hypothetical protein
LLAPVLMLLNVGMARPATTASVTSAIWVEQHPATIPPARDFATMATDPSNGRVVLFGGACCEGPLLGDTWTWNGTDWVRRSPATSPPARYYASMATDTTTGKVVLFGGIGNQSGILDDTWAWDGTTWALQHPATSPPARIAAAMATDPTTGHVVLFGGTGNAGILQDTWTWTGATWVQQHPATSPLGGVGDAMAGDAATGRVVLFGGDNGQIVNDTWTWDGTNWTQQHPPISPSPRDDSTMATDPNTGHVALFGGNAANGAGTITVGDTWIWDGRTWTEQHPLTSPPPREVATMAAEPASGKMLLFGGGGPLDLNDTWTLQTTPSTPATKDACKAAGWRTVGDGSGKPFRNQGQCVSYVEHHSGR